MLNLIKIFLYIYSISLLSQNIETIEVTYVKAFKHPKDYSQSKPKPFKDIEYILLLNKKESLFQFKKIMFDDLNKSNERFIGLGGGKGTFYKNLEENISICSDSYYGEDFIIQENFNKYSWKLLKESKEILGYKCYKAVGIYEEYSYFFKENRIIEVTVWYTTSLPLPFGPSGFDGLPGLVLESQRGSFYITAINIEFYQKEINFKRPNKGQKIKRSDFLKILNEKSFEITD